MIVHASVRRRALQENRADRLFATVLPCCDASRATLDFVSPYPLQKSLRALLLGIAKYEGPIRVYVNDNHEPSGGHMIGVKNWPCLWNFRDIYRDAHWFALDEEWQGVSRVKLCSLDSCCIANATTNQTSCTKLLSLVAF